jgi:hypothetical protein
MVRSVGGPRVHDVGRERAAASKPPVKPTAPLAPVPAGLAVDQAQARNVLEHLGEAAYAAALVRAGAGELLRDPLLAEIAALPPAERTAAAAPHDAIYLGHIARHAPVFLGMVERLLRDPANQGRELVFLGRGADLLYDVALLVTAVRPELRPLRSRLHLIDLTRGMLAPRLSGSDDEEEDLQADVRAYFAARGVPAGKPVLIIDDYQSAQAITTHGLRAALGWETTSSAVLYSGSRTASATDVYARAGELPEDAVLQASLFLAHNDRSYPNVYDGGRELRAPARGESWFGPGYEPKYARRDPVRRLRNRTAVISAALGILGRRKSAAA